MPAPKDNASSGTVTCPKCKGRKVSARWKSGFEDLAGQWRRAAKAQGIRADTTPPVPAPFESCRPGHCPNSEHLHRICDRCGYAWTTPIAGGVLGPIVQATEPDPPDASRDPGDPPARPKFPPNREIREGDAGPRIRIDDGAPAAWWQFWRWFE